MVFIRIKKFNNMPYGYLVETINTNKGPRQKVKKYLGRVHNFKKDGSKTIFPSTNSKKSFLHCLILCELQNRGFKEKNKLFHNKHITFNSEKLSFNKKNKEAVISLNEGYLCDFTIQRILNFKKSQNLNFDANKLAKYFLESGLQISEENFVKFYQLL